MAITGTSIVQEAVQTFQTGGSTGIKPAKSEYGRTVGEPKLSEEGKKYYEELKKKFGGYDFVLVSKDQIENAKASAAKFANPKKPVVLIDEEKIERMATDKEYRAKYEAVISGASSGLAKLKDSIAASGADVKGYGIQVNDGGMTSYFAVLKKSGDAQKERIEQKRVKSRQEHKIAEKKAEKKKAEKKKAEKRSEEKKVEGKKAKEAEAERLKGDDRYEVISASSIEELEQKLSDYAQNAKMNSVMTDQEMLVGQAIDFKG
jgi:hypothetical protein